RRVTRPPIASRRDASSAPHRSTAALSVVGDTRRTRASVVSSTHSRSPQQKSRRSISELMLLALTLATTINAKPAESAENVRLCALYALRVHTAYQRPQPFPRPVQPAQPPTRPAPTSPAPAGPSAPGAAPVPQVAPPGANLCGPIF